MTEDQQKYFDEQIRLMNEAVTNMQMSFDTRYLAPVLADRAAYLYGLLISAGHMTEFEARRVWVEAGKRIKENSDREVQTMTKAGDDIFDPKDTH